MLDKKGMASMVDAVIFTVILGLLVMNFIIPQQLPEEHAVDNGSIHDDLLRLRFHAAPIFPELGNITLSISEMAALEMNGPGNPSFFELLKAVMQSMLGAGRAWQITFVHGNNSQSFGTDHLDQCHGVGMTERSVAVGPRDAVISRLYVL